MKGLHPVPSSRDTCPHGSEVDSGYRGGDTEFLCIVQEGEFGTGGNNGAETRGGEKLVREWRMGLLVVYSG